MSQQLGRARRCAGAMFGPRRLPNMIRAGVVVLIVFAADFRGRPATGGQGAAAGGGLAELLEAQGWPEQPEGGGQPAGDAPPMDRPEAREMPPGEPQPETRAAPPEGGVVDRLRQAIDDRHATVTGTRLFETLAVIQAEEAVLAGMERTLKQCDVALTATKREVARLQTQSLISGPGADVAAMQMPGAQMALERAAARFQGQFLIVQAKREELQPLYAKAVEAVTEWMGHYREMRRCVGQDRRDPNGGAVVEALESEIATHPDFHDGRVLVAVAHIYHGDPAKAATHLRRVQEGDALGKYVGLLHATDIAFDRALAWVLLGEPKEIAKDTQRWDAQWLNHKSPRHLWLLGLFYSGKGQDQEAERRFDRCLRAAGFHDTKDPPAIGAAFLGDSAFFYLTTSNSKYLRVERARKILDRVPEDDRRWQVLRARAADLAERGRWQEAVEALRDCERRCPLTLVDEVQSQLAAYEQERAWTKPPPIKKKPAA